MFSVTGDERRQTVIRECCVTSSFIELREPAGALAATSCRSTRSSVGVLSKSSRVIVVNVEYTVGGEE